MPRAGRVLFGAAVGAALLVPLVAAAASRDDGERAPSAAPSFQRDVAPILREKCTGCHQVGGIAPFPLETAKQASKWAQAIGAAVGAKVMPPWPPGPASPAYIGEESRQLTPQQRSTILSWAKAGGKGSGLGAGRPQRVKLAVRPGEQVLSLKTASSYQPTAKRATTDDYRCFLLDPKLKEEMYATSANIVPAARSIVHHAVLFRVPAGTEAEAKKLDAASPGTGWPCFGGIGVGAGGAPWITVWVPGRDPSRLPDGTGVELPKGSLVVMQVHYNLLNGSELDRSRAVLTLAPSATGLKPMETDLFTAPVELACIKAEKGRLCNRDAALAELGRKYGATASSFPARLLASCGQEASKPKPSTTSTCSRTLTRPMTIYSITGHMHLLGKSIRFELNPGTATAPVLLDIPRWDFHWQGAYAFEEPVKAKAGDVLRLTCRFDPARRHHGGHEIPRTPRYVLWGEGTTDEMCLAILQVVRG
jgi:hypothetical protein